MAGGTNRFHASSPGDEKSWAKAERTAGRVTHLRLAILSRWSRSHNQPGVLVRSPRCLSDGSRQHLASVNACVLIPGNIHSVNFFVLLPGSQEFSTSSRIRGLTAHSGMAVAFRLQMVTALNRRVRAFHAVTGCKLLALGLFSRKGLTHCASCRCAGVALCGCACARRGPSFLFDEFQCGTERHIRGCVRSMAEN